MSDRKLQTTSIPCAWWHRMPATQAPHTSALAALRIAVECLESGRPLPVAEGELISKAFRMYLSGESDITRNLGLRPPRGKPHLQMQEHRRERDVLIRSLCDRFTGPKSARAAKLAQLLQGPADSSRVTDEEVRVEIERLQREYGPNLPKSTRQVLRVIDGD